MNLRLEDKVDVCVSLYLNYILLFSAMAENYTRHVRAAFKWLAKPKLYLKHKISALFLLEIEFLGYVIFEQRVWVLPGKVLAEHDE